jgi:hypothetical protein
MSEEEEIKKMPEITWGYLKSWALQNGITDESSVMNQDAEPLRDLGAEPEADNSVSLVLDFEGNGPSTE